MFWGNLRHCNHWGCKHSKITSGLELRVELRFVTTKQASRCCERHVCLWPSGYERSGGMGWNEGSVRRVSALLLHTAVSSLHTHHTAWVFIL